MAPVIYHKKIQHMRALRFLFPPIVAVCIWILLDDLMVLLGGPRLRSDSSFGEMFGWPTYDSWFDSILLIADFVILPFTAYILGKYAWRAWRYGSPEENLLHLDDKGLTTVGFGRTTRWSWAEISAFRTGRSLLAGAYLVFDAPALPDPRNRLLTWRRASAPVGRQARKIGDIFDKPITEIGERLNAFHGRNLDNSDSADTSQVPT